MHKLLAIFAAILGEAEQIVPMFIHNPNSQRIEGIVVTTLNGAFSAFAQAAAPATPGTTTTTTTTMPQG